MNQLPMATYAPAFAPMNAAPMALPGPRALNLNGRVKAHIALLPGRPREHGFHPSEMERLCPALFHFVTRARADLLCGDPARVAAAFEFLRKWTDGKRPSATLQPELDIGNDIHDLVKGYLGLIGVLWGVWTCGACGARVAEGFMPRTEAPDVQGRPLLVPAPCRICSGANLRQRYPWEYVEPSMAECSDHARALGALGHMDGEIRILVDGTWCRYVLEIKSAKQEDIKGSTGATLPMPRHVFQASLYGYFRGIPDILFLYVNKNQVNEWKEIIVPVDSGAIEATKTKIGLALECTRTGTILPGARICPDIRDRQARECPAVEMCFGAKPAPDFFGRYAET